MEKEKDLQEKLKNTLEKEVAKKGLEKTVGEMDKQIVQAVIKKEITPKQAENALGASRFLKKFNVLKSGFWKVVDIQGFIKAIEKEGFWDALFSDGAGIFLNSKIPMSGDLWNHYADDVTNNPEKYETKKVTYEEAMENLYWPNYNPLTGETIDLRKHFAVDDIPKMSNEEYLENEENILRQMAEGSFSERAIQKDFDGYKNPELNSSGKVFTVEDIEEMSSDEVVKNQKAIDHQMKNVGIPTRDEAESNSGLILVRGYTRSDGTEVKSYYRSLPK